MPKIISFYFLISTLMFWSPYIYSEAAAVEQTPKISTELSAEFKN